jgi:AraC-like DNA-binding protein
VLASFDADPRTRVLRGWSGAYPWELWLRTPHAALCGLVVELWAGLATDAGETHRALPNGEVALMLHLSAPQRLTERHGAPADVTLRAGFVSGLQERPTTFACIAPATRVVTARLSPIGAWRLLGGVPQAELAQCVIEVDAVLDARSGIRELRERTIDARDLGVALDLLEQWLLHRAAIAPDPHEALLPALAILASVDEAASLATVARASGVSPRRLREVFLREVGLPPKRVARIARFRRALALLAANSGRDVAGVAAACGYYDQPHLYRDFRELAGMTPHAYLRVLGDGAHGPEVVGA